MALVFRRSLAAAGAAAALVLAGAAGCASSLPLPPPGSVDADQFLYQRGMESLAEEHWLQAREYFRRLVDTYPQSTYRPDAKLGIGDAFFGEDRIDSNILAANEYREFLTFFPLHAKADYAQFRLAMSHARQVLAPQRDQTATKEALREVERFIASYPNSALMPEVQTLRRDLRDRLGDYEYRVGVLYARQDWARGAMLRFQYILDTYPDYTRMDRVYYQIAELFFKAAQNDVALEWYQKLVTEYPQSEHLEDAQKRIAEIKAATR
jgi:outer membrane protein assembly factor BamD